jgi:MFS family permease
MKYRSRPTVQPNRVDAQVLGAGAALRSPAPTELVAGAFLMALSSSFGQTFFIALFAPWLKDELGLSDGGFGGLYTLGTLASAATLMWAGKVADHFRIRWLGVAALLALAGTCAAMSTVSAAWALLPVLYGLRLFGQGFPGHFAITGVGRWYVRRRGRMMSLAVLGFPAGEAVIPITAVTLISLVGWRQTWLVAAAILVFVSVPLLLVLLRREPPFDHVEDSGRSEALTQRQWTRAEVLRTPAFFVVLAAVMAPPFVMTGVFFHQVSLVAEKGWTIPWFAAWFPVYAGSTVIAALLTGWLIDRVGSRRLLPLMLLPMAAGVAVLSLATTPLAVPVFMALCAATAGSNSTVTGALWAELFGTRHLGAIRSVVFAAQVVASAGAPGLMGLLLDHGVTLGTQFLVLSGYVLMAVIGLVVAAPRIARITAA